MNPRVIVFLLIAAIVLSCNNNNEEQFKPSLTKEELSNQLKGSEEFQQLIAFSGKTVVRVMGELDNLSSDQKSKLTTLMKKYDSFQQLMKSGASTEKNYYMTLVNSFDFSRSSSLRAKPLIGLINMLRSKFNFAMEDFNSLVVNEVSKEISNTMKSTSGRAAFVMDCNCPAIELAVYIRVLNENYYVKGMSIEEADRQAVVAGNYAFVGCVMACYGGV